MKHLLLFTALPLSLFLTYCQNGGQTDAAAKTAEPVLERADSLVGFKGCERAGFKVVNDSVREFIYQHYTIQVGDSRKGYEDIVVRNDSGMVQTVPPIENGFFLGVARNHLFIDAGTGPDVRDLYFFDLRKNAFVYRTPYVDSLVLYPTGNLYFFTPIEEKDMVKKIECKEKEEWEKLGLRAGYGQRCMYDLIQGTVTKKSEYTCIKLQ